MIAWTRVETIGRCFPLESGNFCTLFSNPIGEEAVTHWFERTFNRTPGGAEVGVILDAMARRDAEQPATESPSERVFLDR